MARINLLPWRAERRKLRQKDFLGMLALAVAVGVLASFLVVSWYSGRISSQNARNEFLKGEIAKVDIQINNARFIRPGGVLDRGDTTFAQQEFDARFECGFDGDTGAGTNGFDQGVGKMDGANYAAFCFNKDRASRIKMM